MNWAQIQIKISKTLSNNSFYLTITLLMVQKSANSYRPSIFMIKEILLLFTFLISILFQRRLPSSEGNQSELYKEVLAAFKSDQTQTKFTRSVKKITRLRTRSDRRSKSEDYSTEELLKLVKCQQIIDFFFNPYVSWRV